jgi:hypothetical protein
MRKSLIKELKSYVEERWNKAEVGTATPSDVQHIIDELELTGNVFDWETGEWK